MSRKTNKRPAPLTLQSKVEEKNRTGGRCLLCLKKLKNLVLNNDNGNVSCRRKQSHNDQNERKEVG